MRLDGAERYSRLPGPLQRLDPRLKLVATLVFVVAVVLVPVGNWKGLVGAGLLLSFLVGMSGVPPRVLLARWLGFLVLFGFLTILVAPARPERAQHGLWVVALTILAKDSLAFLATLLLVHVTAFPDLLRALRRLGVPLMLVSTLQFMYRYLFVLMDELERMTLARRARSFRRSGRLDWVPLTSLIGVLFLRTHERGERVHAAMRARGWDGTPRGLD